MSRIVSRPIGGFHTRIRHVEAGAEIETQIVPREGAQSLFTSTDLVAAGLASCIASSLERVVQRRDVPLDAVRVGVVKELGTEPKRISGLPVTIEVDAAPDDQLREVMLRTAASCPVHRSLHPDINSPIEVIFTQGAGEHA
jgi:putative redox protein